MSQSQTFESLVSTVRESIELLDKIKGLFAVHENAMGKRNLDTIEDNNEALAKALMQLNENFRQRIEIQSSLVPDLNEESWENFMTQQPEQARTALQALWKQLDTSLEEVKTLSLINQQIVRRGQQQIDQLVSILQGKGSVDKIYNKLGSSGHVNAQSTIGKA